MKQTVWYDPENDQLFVRYLDDVWGMCWQNDNSGGAFLNIEPLELIRIGEL